MVLIDSDVLIWHTRGHAAAKARLARLDAWRISAVTYMELAQGCRNQQELQRAKRGLARKNTEIIPITPAICERAMGFIDAYALSEGLQLADALIAATAIERQLTLLTANTRHFSAIQGKRSFNHVLAGAEGLCLRNEDYACWLGSAMRQGRSAS